MKITMHLVACWLALVTMSSLTSNAWAHGGGSEIERDGAPSDEPPTPYADPLDFWPFTRHSNETPARIQSKRDALKEKAEKARRGGASSQDLRALDGELGRLEIDLEIARKRQDRDTMRKDGRREQAEVLEAEIHQLKAKRQGNHPGLSCVQ